MVKERVDNHNNDKVNKGSCYIVRFREGFFTFFHAGTRYVVGNESCELDSETYGVLLRIYPRHLELIVEDFPINN